MKLLKKLEAYLIWGCIYGFFVTLIQIAVFACCPFQNIFVGFSIFIWIYFAVFTHICAREMIRGNEELGEEMQRLEEELPKQFGTNEKCGKCGSELVFDHTSDRGTTVEFRADRLPFPRKVNLRTIRNARMPFLWVYFKCPKCGWGLCTTSKSKDVFIVKSDEGKKK